MMIIPIRYKYKSYPNAPRATKRSMALGMATSFVAMALWSFLFMGIIGRILIGFGLKDEIAYIIGAALIIPFIYAVLKWKKHAIRKIDEDAASESIQMLSMSLEEKQQMEEQQKKQWLKNFIYILGGFTLMIVIIIVLAKKT